MTDRLANELASCAHVPTMVALPQLQYKDAEGTPVEMTLVGLPTEVGCKLNDGLSLPGS